MTNIAQYCSQQVFLIENCPLNMFQMAHTTPASPLLSSRVTEQVRVRHYVHFSSLKHMLRINLFCVSQKPPETTLLSVMNTTQTGEEVKVDFAFWLPSVLPFCSVSFHSSCTDML